MSTTPVPDKEKSKTSRVSRRALLAASCAALGSVSFVPYLYSSQQPQSAPGPNERITFGAIGTSRYRPGIWDQSEAFDGRGTFIARDAANFAEPVAAADCHRPHAEYFANYFPGRVKTYTDYREPLADETIDAVTIGTPDHWHVKIAVDALRAGKHVYVEKPLSLTMAETRLIVEEAKKSDRIVQVGSQQRTENDTFRKAAAMCRSGRLGKIRSVVCSCPGNESIGHRGVYEDRTPFAAAPVPEGLDWNFWLGQAPYVDYVPERCFYNFRWWFDYSGGEVTNWGGHNVDFAVWALDRCGDAPVKVSGTGKFPNIPGWYDVAEEFSVDLDYADGLRLTLKSGENEVIIAGTEGRIRVNRGRLTGKPVEILTEQDERELAEVMDTLMKGKQPGNHRRNFFESIADGALPVSDVFSTASGINICHMANICLRVGHEVAWDQGAYTFAEEDAAAMVSRPQREGFEVV